TAFPSTECGCTVTHTCQGGRMSEHTGGLSEAEREAVRQRAAELREQNRPAKGAAKRKREAEACDKAIAEHEGTDHRITSRLHDIVARVATHLDPKTWHG